ncbi:addiction module toxin RelE [Pluralibacter gergoviae]|nr:addiction module toxin RelE [Pluralibacter gergoviae]PHH45658.1 addiction module toxin RelE [Pluralibacter gergoviae]
MKTIIYTKSFKLRQGGKRVNPRELTPVSDWGERQICQEQI